MDTWAGVEEEKMKVDAQGGPFNRTRFCVARTFSREGAIPRVDQLDIVV